MNNRVKALMVLRGISQRQICRQLHVKPATVSLIVSGKKKSARIRTAIADALGVKVSELWPERTSRRAA